MEAELFSTDLTHRSQLEVVEVTKGIIELNQPQLTEQHGQEQDADVPGSTDENWEERDGWPVEHPTLRER